MSVHHFPVAEMLLRSFGANKPIFLILTDGLIKILLHAAQLSVSTKHLCRPSDMSSSSDPFSRTFRSLLMCSHNGSNADCRDFSGMFYD